MNVPLQVYLNSTCLRLRLIFLCKLWEKFEILPIGRSSSAALSGPDHNALCGSVGVVPLWRRQRVRPGTEWARHELPLFVRALHLCSSSARINASDSVNRSHA